jgi:hypothetical protein
MSLLMTVKVSPVIKSFRAKSRVCPEQESPADGERERERERERELERRYPKRWTFLLGLTRLIAQEGFVPLVAMIASSRLYCH